MAPKVKNARVTLSTLAQPSKPVGKQQQANLHTMEITVDNILLDGAKGEEYRALRVVVADGNSIAAGAPAKYHGLNTFTPRAFHQMELPQVPTKQGVIEAVSQMIPPETSKNPYQNISWIFMLVGYGTTLAAAKRAAEFIAKKTVAVLTEAMLDVDMEVPAVDAKGAWSAESTIEGNRLKMVRKGTKTGGGTFEITELFNFKLRLSNDLSPAVRKIFQACAFKHKSVMSVMDIVPGNAFPQQDSSLKTSSSAQTSTGNKKGKKKMTRVKKTIAKKPARRA